ncbi:unnamed protein product [Tilletia controversa]|nr:unnamed protein product [Tilletia controversa]CAD6919822.1 unnamed protein product [Tilletia controversa]CAD6925721.1 unnamed protein product [Tilletia controversa]
MCIARFGGFYYSGLFGFVDRLTGALRAVHRAGLAVRCLEASKVLRTGQNRIRIGGCSIFDVLQFDPSSSGPNKPIARQQADDLLSLGILLLQLGTNSIGAGRDAGSLGLINERPEFDHDPRWSETGDRYIIKLFRDFVFHAVDPETGAPVVDLSYILTNLNKLDAGSEEKIVLTSRDEQSCLVVSYRDIKNCIENAFQDLARPR